MTDDREFHSSSVDETLRRILTDIDGETPTAVTRADAAHEIARAIGAGWPDAHPPGIDDLTGGGDVRCTCGGGPAARQFDRDAHAPHAPLSNDGGVSDEGRP